MEQAGTAFVQIVPSFKDFHRTIATDMRRNAPRRESETVGRDLGRSLVSGMSRGLRAVGGAISTSTRSAARSFVQITRSAGEFASETIRNASLVQNAVKGIAPAVDPGWRAFKTLSQGIQGVSAATTGVHTQIYRFGRVAGRALDPVIGSVRGVHQGLRGVYTQSSGVADRFNTFGLAANTAFEMGREGTRLLSSGMRGVGVSASESNSRMYQVGTTLRGIGERGRAAWGAVSGAATRAASGIGGAMTAMAGQSTSSVGGVSSALTRMGAVGSAAVAAIGFGRMIRGAASLAVEIQQTSASMAGLYGDTALADDMMRRLRDYAASTPLETQSLYQAGSNLAYLGLQGDRAMGVVENVGTALQASGNVSESAMSNVTQALLSMQSAGQLYAGDIQKVSNEMVPAWDMLAEHMGMSIADVRAEVTAGNLTVDDFIAALEAGDGDYFQMMRDSAEQTNQTFRAQFAQVKDNILTTFAETLVPMLDRAAPLVGRFGDAVEGGLQSIPGLLGGIRERLQDAGIIDGFREFARGVVEFGAAAAPAVQSFVTVLGGAFGALLLVLSPLGSLLQSMAGWMRENEEIVRVLGAALAGVVVAITAIRVVTTAWAVAQWALNAAMTANPIGVIIALIVALVAGIIYAYQNFEGFRNVVDSVFSAVADVAMWLWDTILSPVFSAIGTAAMWLWENALQPAFTAIGDAAVWLWENAIKPAWDGISAAFRVIADVALWLWDTVLSPVFNFIGGAAKALFVILAVVVLAPLVIAFTVLSTVVMWLWEHAVQPAFTAIADIATWLWESILKPAWERIERELQILGLAFRILWHLYVKPAWESISDAVSGAWSFLKRTFSQVVSTVRGTLGPIFQWLYRNIIQPVWSGIRSAIDAAWSIIRGIFDAIRSFVSNVLGPIFQWLQRNVIQPVWSTIRSVISNVWNSGIRPVFDALRRGVDRVKSAFETARDGIRTAWQQLRSITRRPVEFVVNTVYNDGIRKVWNAVAGLVDMKELPRFSFDRGGIMPGYTPGRDVHQFFSPTGGGLELSGGEAIMRPEWTAAVGPGFVDAMNAAARTGGTAAVRAAMGFSRGGIVPVQSFNRGGLFGRVTSFASTLGDIFTGGGLRTAAKTVLDPILEDMSGQFTEGRWAQALTAIPRTMVSRLVDWLRDVIGPKLGGDAKKVVEIAKSYVGLQGNPNQFTRAFGMDGLPWCAMYVSEVIKEAKAEKAYNNVRSAAVSAFANSSMDSVTGTSNARSGDLAVYRGRGPGNWGHINIYAGDGVTYGGNESNGVRRHTGYANRAAKFMRPKFARGGILEMQHILGQNYRENRASQTPMLTAALRDSMGMRMYDQGGWLMPGAQAVVNATGRPEAVLTPDQSDALVRMSRRAPREGHTFHVHGGRDARGTARATVNALRDYETLHPTA